MPYYLRHYFDPDFNHQQLKPEGDEASDVYSLGYVQNVIAGQVLAELLPLDEVSEPRDPRFVLQSPVFPQGANTLCPPRNPRFLLAAVNGYVFYLDGKITVKNLLNVRQDVSFQTGNIYFVGNMCVHGSVRSGFAVQANNVRIMGRVEGGKARARRDMEIDGGARGGASRHSKLDAGGKLLTPFLENVEARSRDNMVVAKNCLYCTVYAGKNLVVREKLYGGVVNAYGSVYVGEQLGNRAGLATKVYLGYDPMSIRQLEKIDRIIAGQSQTITHLNAIAGHLPPDANDASRRLHALRQQREGLIARREVLWQHLDRDERFQRSCRLICPGTVYPGVEIAIGRAFLEIGETMNAVSFRLADQDIVAEPAPAAAMGPAA